MNKDNITVEYISTGVLRLADYNPRTHTMEQSNKLKESIKRFGLVDPIICNSAPDRKNIIIGGHFRYKVAKELGYTTLPVVYLNIPDIEKEKELNIRLNKNTGSWDFELLKSFELDLLIDIGFDQIDLSKAWNNDLEVKEEKFDVKKELAQIKEPQTKLGDIICLGRHKLICGDSTDSEVLKKLFGDEKASMIYSDPVYNINLNYNGGVGGKKNYNSGINVSDNRSDAEYKKLLSDSLRNALSVCKKETHVFYFCDQTYIGMVQDVYRDNNIDNKRVCLWIKNGHNPTPNSPFNKCYEPCVYGSRNSPYIAKDIQNLNEVMNKDIGTGNEMLDQIDLWLCKRLSSKDYEHATSKPPELHEKAIRRCTKVDDIILDSFSGSASTLIAGEMLKRKVYAVELEPIFCDLAIRRFEKLTGIKAKVIREDEKA